MNKNCSANELLVQRHGSGVRLLHPEDKMAGKYQLPTLQDVFDLPVNIYVLNDESQYQYLNERTADSCGYISVDDALGYTIRKVAKADTADEIIRNDRNVMRSQASLIKHESYTAVSDEEISGISFKFPWMDGEDLQGVFGCTILTNDHIQLAKALSELARVGILWQGESRQALHDSGMQINGIYFNRSELNIMRHIIYGRTVKEIGKLIGLSHRTVEHYLEKIRLKTNLQTRPELIQFFIHDVI